MADTENETIEETTEQEDTTEQETTEDESTEQEAETFPREYVQKLRDESAKYRTRAQQSDDLAKRLHTALVSATGTLADPDDLPFDEAHLDDPEALTAAIEALTARKPHLASRTPRGNVGQGHTSADTVDLASILRAGAN